MIDRRKNIYCGPEHKIIPTLGALMNWLRVIENTAKELNMTNYGGHKHLIEVSAKSAMAEVDKLIMIDCKAVETKRRESMTKVVVGLCMMFCFLCTTAFAVTTSGTSYNTGAAWVDQVANQHLNHTHDVTLPDQYNRDNEVGVGVDLVVWENAKETTAVEVQEKWDTQNEENSVYVVGKVNLWKMFKKEK